MLRPATWVADTVADLEAEIGLAPGSLQATVAAYNDAAARGEDPLLHKKPEWLKPIGSPVGAIDLRESTGGFTLGGLQHHIGRRGAARQRRTHPGTVRRRPFGRGAGRLGLRQRHLAG